MPMQVVFAFHFACVYGIIVEKDFAGAIKRGVVAFDDVVGDFGEQL